MLTRHNLQFLISSSFSAPHCGQTVMVMPPLFYERDVCIAPLLTTHLSTPLNKAHAHSFGYGLRAVRHLQFAVNVLHLAFHGHFAPELARGYLFVAASLGCQPDK